jgi:hypothetical protein
MSKFVMFAAWLVAVVAGIIAFNLIIGVFGLNQAIVTLVIFIIFAVYTSFRSQPEENEPYD